MLTHKYSLYLTTLTMHLTNMMSVSSVGAQRPRRKPRPPTKGKLLDDMTNAMGRRLPIQIAPGKRRPEQPVQAAKLASEAGIITRSSMPILTHWKHYKNDETQLKEFMGQLSVSKSYMLRAFNFSDAITIRMMWQPFSCLVS